MADDWNWTTDDTGLDDNAELCWQGDNLVREAGGWRCRICDTLWPDALGLLPTLPDVEDIWSDTSP